MDGTKDENATYADVTMLGVLILPVQVCTKRVSVAAALKRFFPKKIRFRFYTTVCVPGTWYICTCTCYTYTSTRIYMYEYPCTYLFVFHRGSEEKRLHYEYKYIPGTHQVYY